MLLSSCMFSFRIIFLMAVLIITSAWTQMMTLGKNSLVMKM